jgi:hypothetical protein
MIPNVIDQDGIGETEGLERLATAAVLFAQLIGSKNWPKEISFGRPRFLPDVQFRQLLCSFGHPNCRSGQRVTEVFELVITVGFPALITPAVCGEPASGSVRDDTATPATAMPATSATITILRWVDRSAL